MKQNNLVGGISLVGLVLALAATPAMSAIGGSGSTNVTTTTSTSSSQQIHNNFIQINNYNTRVLGLASWTGATCGQGFRDRVVYDQSFNTPLGSQEVNNAYNQAHNEVVEVLESTGGRGQIVVSEDVQVNSSSSTTTTETGRTSTETVTVEFTIGPGTVIIGDRDSGGTTFNVLAGQQNFNTNTHTHTDIFNDVTTITNTDSTYTVSGDLDSSPIVLDLLGKGLEASQGNWKPHPKKFYAKHRVLFDFFGNGFPVAMEWVGPNDGLLVKPKRDGSVDGSCLFGNANGYAHGYEQLAAYDENLDGKVKGRELEGLSVWQDKNGNAKCEAGELRSVQQWGISELSVKHDQFKSTYVIGGKTRAMYDWWPTMFELKRTKQPI